MSESEKPLPVDLAVITGLSGSGKSTVAKCFEDLGYYCVDNLPPSLLAAFLEDPETHLGDQRRVAVVTDVRTPGFARELPRLLEQIDRRSVRASILFLDASDEILIRRFSETRRSHPLGASQALIDAIREERQLLSEARGAADLVFETSEWSIHELRHHVFEHFGRGHGEQPQLLVWLTSFGFKHGVPYGTDLLFDVRFLTNPYFEPELREKSGRDPEVVRFLEADPDFVELVDRLADLLLYLLPRYQAEKRSYLSVSIGCTGGHHRSVAVSERLASRLADVGMPCQVNHRDIDK